MKQLSHFNTQKKQNISKIFLLFILCLFINPLSATDLTTEKTTIKLATTTSTENSGLLAYLLPEFEKETGYKVHTIAVGTGKALRMGTDGDVDVILVHAKKAEEKFIAGGNGARRYPVMMNDFIILGPQDDPAHLATSNGIDGAFKNIASSGSKFISRGDDSGTNKKELAIWKQSKIQPKGYVWYIEAGQGMGKVLQMAGEMNAYTLSDRGTWLAYASKSPLKIVFEGAEQLFNPYGIIAVSPVKYPDINNKGAMALIHWITSEKGQKMIGEFKIGGKVLFKPTAISLEDTTKTEENKATQETKEAEEKQTEP